MTFMPLRAPQIGLSCLRHALCCFLFDSCPSCDCFLQETKASDLIKPLSEISQTTQEVAGFVTPFTVGSRPRIKQSVSQSHGQYFR